MKRSEPERQQYLQNLQELFEKIQEGNVLDVIRYDDYITFLDVVGDKIIYFKLDSDWEVWWADKEDIRDLSEKGVRIGPLNGAALDTLGD